ncbi:hypothetical protein CR513_38654, partial [Mucuna pruriens]
MLRYAPLNFKIYDVTSQMKAYGEIIIDNKIVEKILISIFHEYNAIVTTIEKTRDLLTLSVIELMGSLEAYQQRMNRHNEDY